MRTQAALIGLLAGLSLLNPSYPLAQAGEDSGWKEVFRNEMITVYKKEIPGSDVLAYKGSGTLDAPIGKLLSVVLDVDRRKEWMSHVQENEIVRQISPTERIEYMHLSPPWPIKDRDIVYRETIEVDRPHHTITMRFRSVEDPSRPVRPDRVRAEIYDAVFTLTPADGGKKTAIEAESHADPKGSIPKWIVNLYQRRIPAQSLRKLLDQARKPDIQDHPLAREVLGQG